MRIIIKDADFSEVSIGKIVKDLSFSYDNGTKVLGILVNPPTGVSVVSQIYSADSGVNPAAKYYNGSVDSAELTETNNAYRYVSELIEVSPGMVITGSTIPNTTGNPSVVAFDYNMDVLTPSECAWSNDGAFSYTVPNGVKYISFQMVILSPFASLTGTMPE